MKLYKPVATYHLTDDIIALFPNSTLKGDEASIIWQRYNEGFGEPRKIAKVDEEAYYTEEDIKEDANFVLSGDGIHGVRFTRGDMSMLLKGCDYNGFFIDLYELVEDRNEDEVVPFSGRQLKVMSERRREEDSRIKQCIIQEFKDKFKNPGEGLDFFQYCGNPVYGMLDTTGEIGRMILNEDGKIVVELGQEYEDSVEEFESRYFACDDFPQLLLNVRTGIKRGWFVDEMEDYAGE